MKYRSIFTVWDGLENSRSTFQTALQLARVNDAHLSVLCIGYEMIQPAFGYVDVSSTMVNENYADARNQVEELKREVTSILEVEDVKWGVETIISQTPGLSHAVGDAARFSDLVILPKPYEKDGNEKAANIVEAALFEGNVPVLVHPSNSVKNFGKRVLIAWNESNEALTAIRAALPFISAAEAVEIVIIDPARHDTDRSDPGSAISTMLARHGVSVEVSILPRTVSRISDILNQHITETGADFLVMGAYGHSRFRERILGGATRNTLESVLVPVLMAH